MSNKKYGIMPEQPSHLEYAKVRGDAGTYRIWAIDWLNHQVQIERAGEYEWLNIDKVQVLASKPEEAKTFVCSQCKQTKPYSECHGGISITKYGLHCRDCHSEIIKDRP